MGFFDNLFGNAEDYARKEEQRELARQERERAIQEAQEKNEKATPIFQVGTTEDGRVTLRVSNYAGWVTMTDTGVDQLIAMLQAAKGQPEDVKIKDDEEEEEC